MEGVVQSMRVRAEIAASGGAVGLAESASARPIPVRSVGWLKTLPKQLK